MSSYIGYGADHLPGACVLFTGAKHKRGGYGLKWYQGKLWYAPRLVAHAVLGETPDGRLREPVLLGIRNDVLTPD